MMVTRPNVWAIDNTYILMARGFVYLVFVLDWRSRHVFARSSWAQAFTGGLADNGIAISMDGKGAWRDNVFVERLWRSVKYEGGVSASLR